MTGFRYSLPCLSWLLGAWLAAVPACSQGLENSPAAGPNPEDFVKLGIQEAIKGDLDGAQSAFDKALKLDPRWVPALEKKGLVFLRQNKPGEAIKYFDQAVQIDPTYEDAWYYRGVAYGGLANFDAAISDFSHVIALNPKYVRAYASRGKARFFKNDFNGTVADMTQTLALDPQQTDSYYYRGLGESATGTSFAAEADFQHSSDAGLAYGAFWLWITGMENGKKDLAQTNLSDYLDQHKASTGDWTKSVGDFLLGRIKQAAFLSRAGQADPALAQPCEAWFFIGISKRLAGDAAGARDAFRQAVASGSKSSVEYVEAQLELSKLLKP